MRIFPLGDSALTVEFGNAISVELNEKAIALSELIETNGFPGFIESASAYASTTIYYQPAVVRQHFTAFPNAFEAVKSMTLAAIGRLGDLPVRTGTTFEIPVRFDDECALDLEYIAEKCSLSADEVIEIFISRTYRVFMLGFLPGFAYMGKLDARIEVKRKDTPRLAVPKGSVGIAGGQTGIYSLVSPGGWQIIGRTEVEMFSSAEKNPSFLEAGDSIRFYRL